MSEAFIRYLRIIHPSESCGLIPARGDPFLFFVPSYASLPRTYLSHQPRRPVRAVDQCVNVALHPPVETNYEIIIIIITRQTTYSNRPCTASRTARAASDTRCRSFSARTMMCGLRCVLACLFQFDVFCLVHLMFFGVVVFLWTSSTGFIFFTSRGFLSTPLR